MLTLANVEDIAPDRGIFIRFVAPVLLCVGLAWAGLATFDSLSAVFGNGVRGTFTAQYCEQGKGGCFWVGDFVSADGRDVRYGVGVDGSSVLTTPGQQIAALDTGNPMDVYPVGFRYAWGAPSIFTVALLFVFGAWVVKVPVSAMRRRARVRRKPRP
ncbi:hypothetical protein KDL01_00265 [Actinospica durhamensis]|uniref:Uncharacterized protein n=1 Tax=Actinospica durhamensis TaxID=1508375 RepID=A0A941EJ25_9ACTN|nr:hypothetical protein [Actinospica durhamensis]MBR7831670.1 hypothetical protein [Actinospica durhamensis]